jgi:class 3 adenylate cyclase
VAQLGSSERSRLPNSAFAYVDSKGKRRLPINDAAHVRNALARFNQVTFEDEAAREKARTRLLNAAKKYRIVPVGFVAGQFQAEREYGRRRAGQLPVLPNGFVTMLMTDLQDSTTLVHRLGDGYRDLINDVRALLRTCALAAGGHVVETRADDFFAVFESPASALATAIAIQCELRTRSKTTDVDARMRIGIHSGYPTLNDNNYIGMPVHITARVCNAAHGNQILVSGDTKLAVRDLGVEGLRFVSLGEHRLRGIPQGVPLFQVAAKGLTTKFPPPRTTTK